jgi:hypothetical protein
MATDVALRRLTETFGRMREQMLEQHEGQWALVIEGREPDFFDHEQDAIDAGFWETTDQRFLVKQVLADDLVLTVSAVSAPESE